MASGGDDGGIWHISSAVVLVSPPAMTAARARIAALPGVEIHAADDRRLVLVLEGPSAGELGARLAAINLMDGVLSANMVFEHAQEAGIG